MILHAGFDLITACGRVIGAAATRSGRCAATTEDLFAAVAAGTD